MAREYTDIDRLYKDINIILRETIESEFKKELVAIMEKHVFRQFYDKYKCGKKGRLVDSITVEMQRTGGKNQYRLFLFFDAAKIDHTSLYGSEGLGIKPGDIVYTPQWINDGWTYLPNAKRTNRTSKSAKRIRDVGKVDFLGEAEKELNRLTATHVQALIKGLRKQGFKVEI